VIAGTARAARSNSRRRSGSSRPATP
jgi:hypothetical protein